MTRDGFREQEQFSDSLKQLGDAIKTFTGSGEEMIRIILGYMGRQDTELSDGATSTEKLVNSLRRKGIYAHQVRLKGKWWLESVSVLLCVNDKGRLVLLLPWGINRYRYVDAQRGRYRKLRARDAKKLQDVAWSFYYPLPREKIGLKDILSYAMKLGVKQELIVLAVVSCLITLLSLLLPHTIRLLLTRVLSTNLNEQLIGGLLMLTGVTAASALLGLIRNKGQSRLRTRTSVPLEAALYLRVLKAPPSFFRKQTPAEISSRLSILTEAIPSFISACFTIGVSFIFSLIYLVQMLHMNKYLVWPALVVLLLASCVYIAVAFLQRSVNRRRMRASAQSDSVTYEMLQGIRQIRRSGAEKRAFSKWAEAYSEETHLRYAPPILLVVYGVIVTAITLLGTSVIYGLSVAQHIQVADYYAFNTTYGLLSSSIMGMTQSIMMLAGLRPALETARSILDIQPETAKGKTRVDSITGEIDINHVTFRYEEDAPLVLDDISLHISPGDSVAIVGETGCGKSTLMRTMLGLETPSAGTIYYDNRNMRQLELMSLRGKIGAVLQDGDLIEGDILQNITLAMRVPDEEAAWRAAEIACLADDIRKMPMGMHTAVSTGSGLSTGQRQRLLIARAVAHKPAVLFLDEATSALDNIVQRRVMDNIRAIKCTTVMIAHRLSTIEQCDRILVMEKGHIIADGKHEELLEKCPFYAELVRKQSIG